MRVGFFLFGVDASYFNWKRRNVSLPLRAIKSGKKLSKRYVVVYRKMLLLPNFISNHFGTFVTQGHYHKLYFVLDDYAVD